MTRAQAKLNVPELNDEMVVTPDDENSNETTNDRNIPFLKYVPKVYEISWSVTELRQEQQIDPFCREIIELIANKLTSN